MASTTLIRTKRRLKVAPMKRPASSRAIRSVSRSPDTIAELLQQLGDIPPERVRLRPPPGLARSKDLLRLVERDKVLCELVSGVLVEKALGWDKCQLRMALTCELIQFVRKSGDGVVLGPDAPYRLKRGLIRLPDASYVARCHLPQGSLGNCAIAPWPPDLAVEILCDGNTRREIDLKRQEYFDAGVTVVWVVDPRQKSVRVYTDSETFVALGEADQLDGGDVLPGFMLSIREWFAKVE